MERTINGYTYTIDSSWVDSLSEDEKKMLTTGLDLSNIETQDKINASNPQKLSRSFNANYDDEVDWRNRNGKICVTPVKNQAPLNSCVSFATCALLESMNIIEHDASLDLSEADLFLCGSHGPYDYGWWINLAAEEVIRRGVTLESLFPYASGYTPSLHCSIDPSRNNNSYTIDNYTILYSMEEQKTWLTNIGPLMAHMYTDQYFSSYHSGVYFTNEGSGPSHVIEIIGYSESGQYWICKNSWSTGFGMDGYFYMGYGSAYTESWYKLGVQGIKKWTPVPLFLNQEYFNAYEYAYNYHNFINVYSDSSWHATTDANWLTITTSGNITNFSLDISINANTSPCPKLALITVSNSTDEKTLLIKQRPAI